MRFDNKNNVVLVADDDLFVRKIIRAALQDLAEIVEVTDGALVQEAYKKCHPDLVFLDIHLPNISGMDLIRPLIRADQGAYVVMLSADSSTENVRDSRLRGSRGFLTKPFDKKRIMHFFNSCPTIRFVDS
jgi:two-component system, chemotaxis family, chemotaxis protein CheY